MTTGGHCSPALVIGVTVSGRGACESSGLAGKLLHTTGLPHDTDVVTALFLLLVTESSLLLSILTPSLVVPLLSMKPLSSEAASDDSTFVVVCSVSMLLLVSVEPPSTKVDDWSMELISRLVVLPSTDPL